LRLSFQLLAEAGTVAVFAYLLWRVNKWMAMFLVIVCLSSFFPQYDKASFLASHAVFYGLVWYYVVFIKGDMESILNVLCIIAILNSIILCLQYFGIDPIFASLGGGDIVHKTGLMANQNETSAVLALCFPAFLRNKWKFFIPFIFVGFFITGSFGGFIAVIAGLIYYLWSRINKGVLFVSVLIAIIAFTMVDNFWSQHRLDTWIVAFKLYTQHFIFGSGIGHWKYVFEGINIKGYEGTVMLQAHNEFVQGVFEMGIPFIVVLIGFILSLRIKKLDDIFKVAMIIILINCSVNFTLHIAVTAYIVLTWLALIDKSDNIRLSRKGETTWL